MTRFFSYGILCIFSVLLLSACNNNQNPQPTQPTTPNEAPLYRYGVTIDEAGVLRVTSVNGTAMEGIQTQRNLNTGDLQFSYSNPVFVRKIADGNATGELTVDFNFSNKKAGTRFHSWRISRDVAASPNVTSLEYISPHNGSLNITNQPLFVPSNAFANNTHFRQGYLTPNGKISLNLKVVYNRAPVALFINVWAVEEAESAAITHHPNDKALLAMLPDVTRADIIGTWSTIERSTSTEYTYKADGTFESKGFNFSSASQYATSSGQGTWSLKDGNIFIETSAQGKITTTVIEKPAENQLRFFGGDLPNPAQSVLYTRTEAGAPPFFLTYRNWAHSLSNPPDQSLNLEPDGTFTFSYRKAQGGCGERVNLAGTFSYAKGVLTLVDPKETLKITIDALIKQDSLKVKKMGCFADDAFLSRFYPISNDIADYAGQYVSISRYGDTMTILQLDKQGKGYFLQNNVRYPITSSTPNHNNKGKLHITSNYPVHRAPLAAFPIYNVLDFGENFNGTIGTSLFYKISSHPLPEPKSLAGAWYDPGNKKYFLFTADGRYSSKLYGFGPYTFQGTTLTVDSACSKPSVGQASFNGSELVPRAGRRQYYYVPFTEELYYEAFRNSDRTTARGNELWREYLKIVPANPNLTVVAPAPYNTTPDREPQKIYPNARAFARMQSYLHDETVNNTKQQFLHLLFPNGRALIVTPGGVLGWAPYTIDTVAKVVTINGQTYQLALGGRRLIESTPTREWCYDHVAWLADKDDIPDN